MCEPTFSIRLCTCKPEEIDPDRSWTIYKTGAAPAAMASGSVVPPERNPERMSDKILADLASTSCFDFDYDPTHGDILHITVDASHFWFEYDSNWHWAEAESAPPIPDRVTVLSGRLAARRDNCEPPRFT